MLSCLNNTDNLHFHCIIIDNHQVNHNKFNKNGYDLLAGTRDSKKGLVKYIANQAGKSTTAPGVVCSSSARSFTICKSSSTFRPFVVR